MSNPWLGGDAPSHTAAVAQAQRRRGTEIPSRGGAPRLGAKQVFLVEHRPELSLQLHLRPRRGQGAGTRVGPGIEPKSYFAFPAFWAGMRQSRQRCRPLRARARVGTRVGPARLFHFVHDGDDAAALRRLRDAELFDDEDGAVGPSQNDGVVLHRPTPGPGAGTCWQRRRR